jgi:hydroxyethylthiazole kinase-like uncharacterized protein yjeF
MREIEQKGQELGITKLMMMENAGSAIAGYVHENYAEGTKDRSVKVVGIGGTGNNGGDVFAAVRHLAYWPIYVLSVVLVGSEDEIRAEEAKTNWQILKKVSQIEKIVLSSEARLNIFEKEISNADVLIIGIFGTGFKGIPRALQLKVIEAINNVKKPVKISVDIPSGMDGASGKSEYAISSDVTITMHAPKMGMLTQDGRKKSGKIVVANLGLPF